jgi:hypothetical protein
MRKLLLAMMLLIAAQTSAMTLAATKVSFLFTDQRRQPAVVDRQGIALL